MKVIDVTLLIEEGMQTFSAPWHVFVEISQMGRHGIENRETRKVTFGTHTGTHMDAPRHFIKGGKTIEQIEPERFVGDAFLLDLSDVPEFHPVTAVEIEDRIPQKVERLILRFGWDKHIGTNKYYTDHGFLTPDAAELLLNRGVKLLGMDTPQPDNPKDGRGSPDDGKIHKILLGNECLLLEYLANLSEVKEGECMLIAAPLKLKDGDGAPARCFIIEK